MTKRVMTVYLTLLVAACLGLAVPLCVALAERATANVVLDRTSDAARFASLAEPAVVTGAGGTLASELVAYFEVYGIDALVVDREGGTVASGRPGLTLEELAGPEWAVTSDGLPDAVLTTLAGTRGGGETRLWPWSDRRLLITEPIGSGGEIVGVVVTASPTEALRRGLVLQWLTVAAAVVVVVLLGSAAAAPLTRWVLRPVAELDDAVQLVGQGQLQTRVGELHGPDELRHLAQSFNEMATTVTTLIERQRTFVAYAGHQIRNPLAALRLRVESLSAQLPEQDRDAHQLALDELDRLARTCDGLLVLAGTDEDEELTTQTVDVATVVADRLRSWHPIAERLEAQIRTDVPEGLTARTIEGALDQALDALLDNALKFGGRGVTISLTAALDPSTQEVSLLLVDDGPGLPEEVLRSSGEPFWTDRAPGGARMPRHRAVNTRASEGAGGNGLGLAIVVTLLGLSGGRLELDAAQPHGVQARISLPAGPGPASDPP